MEDDKSKEVSMMELGETSETAKIIKVEEPSGDPLAEGCFNHMKDMQETYPEIFVEKLGHRIVYLLKKEDRDLFLKVKEYELNHPGAINDAMHEFCEQPNGDAIVNILYSNPTVDYVMKFSYEIKYTKVRIAWEKKLLERGLILEHEPGVDPKDVFVKVYTPFFVLAKEAEIRRINIPLAKQDNQAPPRTTLFQKVLDFFNPEDKVVPEASAPFQVDKLEEFEAGLDDLTPCQGSEPMWKVVRYFFRRGLRNLLTHEIIIHTLLIPEDYPKIEIMAKLTSPKSNYGISQMLSKGIYSKFFPTHDGSHKSTQDHPNMRTTLKQEWALSIANQQPLDQIREYFGEKFALYFAFLGFYTVWLWSAAIVGVIVFIFGLSYALSDDTVSIEVQVTRLFDNALTIPWAIFISIWATFYLEFWKRKNAYLAWWWDVLDFEREETTRPEWYGTKERKSPITGESEFHYPDKLRYSKMIVSCTCIGLAVAIVIVSIMGSIVYQVWSRSQFGECVLNKDLDALCDPTTIGQPDTKCVDGCWNRTEILCESDSVQSFEQNFTAYTNCLWNATGGYCMPGCSAILDYIPCSFGDDLFNENVRRLACIWEDRFYAAQITAALINLFVMVVLNKVFEKVAAILNDWENHKTNTIYEDSLIQKTFFFQFLNSYTSLFYIAFFKGTLGKKILGDPSLRDICSYGSCFTELLVQLAIIFVGKQIINQFQEIGVPYLIGLFYQKQYERQSEIIKKKYSDEANTLSTNRYAYSEPPQWVKDDRLSELGSVLFDDYNEMILQFGFITLFVATFPLGPLFALLNNIIEIRTDAYKLCTSYQRPPGQMAQDIGSWESVLQALAATAVITNAFIVAFTSSWVEDRIVEHVGAENLTAGRLFIVLIFEHVVFGLKILFAYIVPDIPGPVQIAIDRERYLSKLAFEGKDVAALHQGQDYE